MEDRQLLLAKQDYAGTREMLRRVGILAVDGTKSFTVTAIGEAKAVITQILIACKQTDGTMKTFNVFPLAEMPSAVPGSGNLSFSAGAIKIRNDGTVQGTLYIKVVDDVGTQIYYATGFVGVGSTTWNTSVTFDMPARNYGLTIEVGHL